MVIEVQLINNKNIQLIQMRTEKYIIKCFIQNSRRKDILGVVKFFTWPNNTQSHVFHIYLLKTQVTCKHISIRV